METNFGNFQLSERSKKDIKKETRLGKVKTSRLLYEDDFLTGMEISAKDLRWFLDLKVMNEFGYMDRKTYIQHELNELYADKYGNDKRATPKEERHKVRADVNAMWDAETAFWGNMLANNTIQTYQTFENVTMEWSLQDTLTTFVRGMIYDKYEYGDMSMRKVNSFERVNIQSDALPPTNQIPSLALPWFGNEDNGLIGAHIDDHQFFKRYMLSDA